jgi:hypothetical protein
MFERLGGIWFGLALLVGWSLVCVGLLHFARDPLLIGAVAALWLVIVIPTLWGLRRSRLG